jgi:hypothetical protein
MAQNVNFNKTVYKKRTYMKTIDTSFNEIGVKTVQEQIDEVPSVQEFFNNYSTLFYQINELGPTNSHEYLIKTSKEYIGFEDENEIITLLQAEIGSLREQLLDSQKQLASFAELIPGAPSINIPNESSTEDTINNIDATPTTPVTSPPLSNDTKVVQDFNNYPRSSISSRSSRLGLSQSYIKQIKDEYKL